MSDLSDEDLLAGVGRGDRGALKELYDRHAPWLMLRLQRRGADGPLAEEVVQDTFLAVWRNPRSYSGPARWPRGSGGSGYGV